MEKLNMKIMDNKKCLCDNPACAECLSTNCQDDNCKIHTKDLKIAWHKCWKASNGKLLKGVHS